MPFHEILVPHRCSPVGTAVLPNFNPCSAVTLQLGHIQRGYVYMSVCKFETICSELYSLCVCMCVCVWTRTLLWGATRWLWASPCSATTAPCGASHPGWPPRYGTSPSLSSTTCRGSSLWPVHLKKRKTRRQRSMNTFYSKLCYNIMFKHTWYN